MEPFSHLQRDTDYFKLSHVYNPSKDKKAIMRFIKNGFHCKTGRTKDSWFLAGLIYNNVDDDFTVPQCTPESRNKRRLRPGKTMEQWMEADATDKRTLFLYKGGDHPAARQRLSTADRIFGPAIPYETVESPTAAWIERTGLGAEQRYRLMLFQDGAVSEVCSTEKMLRKLSIAKTGRGVYCAFLIDEDKRTIVRIVSQEGKTIYQKEGRDPVLRSDGERLFLLFDTTKPNAIVQNLEILYLDGSLVEGQYELSADDLNFAADMRYHPDRKLLSMAWETAPVWGADPAVGYHRDLAYAEIDLSAGVSGAAGEDAGAAAGRVGEISNGRSGAAIGSGFDIAKRTIKPHIIPVEKRAFYELRKTIPRYAQNAAPVNPIVVFDGETPSVAYRTFSYIGHRTFGWDAYLIQLNDEGWGPCRKLIDRYGPPDTGYGVEFAGDRRITCTAVNHSVNTPKAIYDLGILIDEQPRDQYFPDTYVPFVSRGFYNIGFPLPDAAPRLPETEYDGYRLIWVDLHAHSCYSKCQANKDGTPLANLRFARDVLGNEVLSHGEHYMFMSAAEVDWVYDRLEEEAGDNCLWIYGNESLAWPSHGTNTFAVDRLANEKLRIVVISTLHRNEESYPAIKKYVPPDSAISIRHFHGRNEGKHGVASPGTVDTHDPELEVAMESMQVRGNFMLKHGADRVGLPQFPNNFLNGEKKVGVVGGSDHSTAPGDPNAFCLTGIWIDEFTNEAMFEAIKQRRTVAAANGKVSVWATMNGRPIGSDVRVTPNDELRIEADIISPHPLIKVSLLIDGEISDTRSFEDDVTEQHVTFSPNPPGSEYHWYSIHIQAYSAHTIGDGYPTDDLDYPWLIVNTSPWFVNG